MLNGSTYSTVKHIFEVVLCQSWTLHIVMGSDAVFQPPGLAEVHWFGAPLVQMNKDVHIVTKVWLSSNQNNGRGRVASTNLWDPFGSDVVKRDRVDQAEAEDEDVHMGIAQRAEMAKLLLSDSIKSDEKHRINWSKEIIAWHGIFTCPAVSISLIRVGTPFTWTKPDGQVEINVSFIVKLNSFHLITFTYQ